MSRAVDPKVPGWCEECERCHGCGQDHSGAGLKWGTCPIAESPPPAALVLLDVGRAPEGLDCPSVRLEALGRLGAMIGRVREAEPGAVRAVGRMREALDALEAAGDALRDFYMLRPPHPSHTFVDGYCEGCGLPASYKLAQVKTCAEVQAIGSVFPVELTVENPSAMDASFIVKGPLPVFFDSGLEDVRAQGVLLFVPRGTTRHLTLHVRRDAAASFGETLVETLDVDTSSPIVVSSIEEQRPDGTRRSYSASPIALAVFAQANAKGGAQ